MVLPFAQCTQRILTRNHLRQFKLLSRVCNYSDERPKVKTLEYQNRLGKLPVPDLKDTIAKFLKTAQPHLTEAEFAETTRKAEQLVEPGGVGEKLHKGLVDRSQKYESWFSDWWLDMAYLEYRERLPAWSSPGFVYPTAKFANENDQVKYASKMIGAAIDYKIMLDKQELAPDMMGDLPLDMMQYYMIFGVHRFPEPVKDRLAFNSDSKHIVVSHNNNFFKVNVFSNNGSRLSQKCLEEVIQKLLAKSKKIGRGPSVGILTSDNRDKCTESFQLLTNSSRENSQSVDTISKSLFTLCLDESNNQFRQNLDPVSRSALFSIHGHGMKHSAGNRWFDKTIQFFVTSGGENGLTLEHSPTDGVAVVAMADYILKKIYQGEIQDVSINQDETLNEPEHLPFVLNQELENAIQSSGNSLQELIDDLDMKILFFNNYGKRFIKSQKFSPDSFVQMAIQYTFYRCHQTPGAHYESGSTRMFNKGRTEVIRSCSNESINFAKTMINESDKGNQYKAMCDAIQAHGKYARLAVRGLGVDRLLQGMKRQALETGVDLPDLFQDPGVVRSARMRLSTSQISGKYVGTFACYGPLVEDGYGVCYSIHDDCLLFAISSFRSNKDTDNQKFYDTIQECLMDMRHICPVEAA